MTILFDLDGTLIDSTEAILTSFQDSFEHFDKETPDEQKIKSLIGYPLDIMYENLGVDKEKVWEFVTVYKKFYTARSKPMTKWLPDAVEAIELASSFATLGVVTTKTGLYSRELLEHMGVMKHFEVLIGREDVTNPKPHPEPILKALELLNADKSKSWMIGDTIMDLESARCANIQSVAVSCGYGNINDFTTDVKKSALEAVKFIESLK